MSEVTAIEALDTRKVTTGPEWWTVSLTSGEGHTRRSRWLACVIHPAASRNPSSRPERTSAVTKVAP